MENKLPYVAKTTYEFDGQLHNDEQSALRAAITATVANPGVAKLAIDECCALAPLLARACALSMGKPPEPPKQPEPPKPAPAPPLASSRLREIVLPGDDRDTQ